MMQYAIFDVDGTLWDSTEQVARSWTQAIKVATTATKKSHCGFDVYLGRSRGQDFETEGDRSGGGTD